MVILIIIWLLHKIIDGNGFQSHQLAKNTIGKDDGKSLMTPQRLTLHDIKKC